MTDRPLDKIPPYVDEDRLKPWRRLEAFRVPCHRRRMSRRQTRVLRDSIQEATGEKFHPSEERERHKMMAGLTRVGTETVDAVSGQGTTTHMHLIEASGVLMNEPVVLARPV
jgi:hypothetical protein